MEYNNKVLKLGGDFTMSSTSYKKEIEEEGVEKVSKNKPDRIRIEKIK